jgi:hypothetical protein
MSTTISRAHRASRLLPARASRAAGALLVAAALLSLATPARAQTVSAADEKAIASYTLTMPKFDAWIAASMEIAESMKGKSEEERQAAAMDLNASASLDEIIAQLDKVPEVRRAVGNARLTTREYVILNLAVIQAMMANAMLQANPNAATPKGVNPANVEFMRANQAQIQARMKELRGK